jgi:putative DNA primase/helicase
VRQELHAEPDVDLLAQQWEGSTKSGESGVRRPEAVEPEKKDLSVEDLANEITSSNWFAKDGGGKLHVYEGGVYKLGGESYIGRRVKELFRGFGLARQWSTRKTTEVMEYIRVDAPLLLETPPSNTINVLNGLIDVDTMTLRPHTPDFVSAVQVPVSFDPDAVCPVWEKFVADVFPEDTRAIAWEVVAWILTPDQSIQKAILLLGEGSNGKSTYLRGVVNVIGKRNTTALSLHKIEQDRFAAARLMGKLANICPDLPTAHLSGTMMFKALTGGDVLSGEYKFKDSFEFLPFCKLVFSANKPPQSDDATHGFFRRWQVVPFNRTFEEGAADTVRREEIDARLAHPAELSGVLNKALLALPGLRKSGFTQSESMRCSWEEFRAATDPLSVWLDQNTVEGANVQILQTDLFLAFNRHMTDSGKQPSTKTAFGLALKRVRPAIVACQRTHMGRPRQWVYAGITIKTEEPESA